MSLYFFLLCFREKKKTRFANAKKSKKKKKKRTKQRKGEEGKMQACILCAGFSNYVGTIFIYCFFLVFFE